MIVSLMPHRKALFKQFFAPFGIDTHSRGICGWDGVIPKDAGHTAQQARYCEKGRGTFADIPIEMVQEELRVFIALRSGAGQIILGDFEILLDLLSLQIQFAKCVFCELIPLPGAFLQIFK